MVVSARCEGDRSPRWMGFVVGMRAALIKDASGALNHSEAFFQGSEFFKSTKKGSKSFKTLLYGT